MKTLRACLRPRRPENEGVQSDTGFTLVELVVAIGLIGLVFAAVAGIMTSSLRSLAVQKARTQGNEVATQAMEDLQRRSFDNLVLCTEPSGAKPAGLDDIVKGSGCPASTAGYGEDPCNGLNPAHAPMPEYSCTRVGVTYNVKRYISWVDAGHTSKRLAVFVTWRDSVGLHEVSQQSSLRAPSAQSVIGLANPTLHTATANASSYVLDANGILQDDIGVTVQSTNLTDADDRVFVKFWVITDEGSQMIESVALSKNGSLFAGTIPKGYRLGAGTQFITYNAVRAVDGKTTSTIGSAVSFCKAGVPCASNTLPFIHTMSVAGGAATIPLTASGGLQNDVAVSVKTNNVSSAGRVQVLLPTLAGIEAVDLTPNAGCEASDVNSCTWTGTVEKSKGFAFTTDSASVYFTAAQDYIANSTTELGSTASKSMGVSFS